MMYLIYSMFGLPRERTELINFNSCIEFNRDGVKCTVIFYQTKYFKLDFKKNLNLE